MVNEIFLSLQGESTYAGLPCVFIRLTGCDLRCSYCDTAYAFSEGKQMSISQILDDVARLAIKFRNVKSLIPLPIVEVTGGEPLLQKSTPALLSELCSAGYVVLIETSGAHDISVTPPAVRRIMDLKCPSSGECDKNLYTNIGHLKTTDEVKFVIATEEDYIWARDMLNKYNISSICPVLFSWAEPLNEEQQNKSLKPPPVEYKPITRSQLAELILRDGLPVRFQVQLHKIIWPNVLRGV